MYLDGLDPIPPMDSSDEMESSYSDREDSSSGSESEVCYKLLSTNQQNCNNLLVLGVPYSHCHWKFRCLVTSVQFYKLRLLKHVNDVD